MVHDAAASGYQAEADVYASARPSYHSALVDRFVATYGDGDRDIIELGAGTGIFTAQLVDAGVEPIAIEPVDAMRSALAGRCPSVRTIGATAELTGLTDSCADTVVVAQAFHWFDHEPALAEIRRILRPGGHLVCVWNVRDTSVPWVRECTEIVDGHAGETPRHRTFDWRRAIDADPAFEPVDDWTVDNPRPSSPDDVVARTLSTSFIATLDPVVQQDVLDRVRSATEGLGPTFSYPYRSELQAWCLR